MIDDLRRSLDHDSEVLDRTAITHWLTQFSAKLPLELYHPKMGRIRYAGITFSGSPIQAFDRFVSLSIEDLVEKHVRAIEAAMAEVEENQLQEVTDEAVGLIVSARVALQSKAGHVKAALLGNVRSTAQRSQITRVPIHSSAETIPVMERLNNRAAALRQARVAQSGRARSWGGLERFAKANPALSNVISFFLGALVTLIVSWLAGTG
jgi:hypothetical protein